MAGFEPAPPEFSLRRSLAIKLPPPMVEDNQQSSAHRNRSGSRDSHPDRPLHGRRCYCYTTILMACQDLAGRRKLACRAVARRARAGAPGRTCTDDYEFTKLALLLLRHGGKMASTAGIAPATSTFARWRSDLTELRGQLASVIGLAPIRPGLKDRLLDLLCIHGQNGPRGWYRANVSSSSGRR